MYNSESSRIHKNWHDRIVAHTEQKRKWNKILLLWHTFKWHGHRSVAETDRSFAVNLLIWLVLPLSLTYASRHFVSVSSFFRVFIVIRIQIQQHDYLTSDTNHNNNATYTVRVLFFRLYSKQAKNVKEHLFV